MLRVRQLDARLLAQVDGSDEEIVRVFDDSLLELVRLLREASNIEHALLVQYLFAAFSLKARYSSVAGGPFDSGTTLFGVAVQEMRHLARVNSLLVKLSASPALDREDFPLRTDLYPFILELEPLTRSSLAKYVAAESPAGALDPNTAPSEDERQFREEVHRALGAVAVNHIGSLYKAVVARLQEAVQTNPGLLPDPEAEVAVLERIRGQGEITHFEFFKSLFKGSHPGFAGKDVWANSTSELFPSYALPKNPTAFDAAPNSIPDPRLRQIAWLSNLHYWTVLGLLQLGITPADADLKGRAISHMTGCILPLGEVLATRGVGVPFDPLGRNFGFGLDVGASKRWMQKLLLTLQIVEQTLRADLPLEYSDAVASGTIELLRRV
jgi:hypothetical protein